MRSGRVLVLALLLAPRFSASGERRAPSAPAAALPGIRLVQAPAPLAGLASLPGLVPSLPAAVPAAPSAPVVAAVPAVPAATAARAAAPEPVLPAPDAAPRAARSSLPRGMPGRAALAAGRAMRQLRRWLAPGVVAGPADDAGGPAGPRRAPRLPRGSLAVPLVRQATDYSCGAASLLAVLYYWRAFGGGESELCQRLQTTPENGTEPPKIVEAARGLGLRADLRTGMTIRDLRAALKGGKTVILDLQAWADDDPPKPWKDQWDSGHYVVLVGMGAKYAYFMDPSLEAGYAYLPIAEFLDRWHDFEDRHGKRQEYVHAGIVVGGGRHLKRAPAGPRKMG